MVQLGRRKWLLYVLGASALGMLDPSPVLGQCSQASSDGYTVNMSFTVSSIIPSSNSCPFGYNYNVGVDYDVTFSGTNIPASLYTLQGTVTCGGTQHFFNLPNGGGTGTVTSVSNPYRSASDCNTATPASLGCTDVDIQISGSGLSNTTITCTASPLPIELLTFTAKPVRNGVLIAWATLTEINNDYFTIERSADGVHYETLATISGAGNSHELLTYEFVDHNPLGGTGYYRLRQTDFDGQTTPYGPLVVKAQEEAADLRAILQPGAASLEVIGTNVQDYVLEVISLQGYTHYQSDIRQATIPLSGLPPATYVLRFTHRHSGQTQVQKLVVLAP